MKAVLFKTWTSVHSSFWFLPLLMSVGALLLALGTLALDRQAAEGSLPLWEWTISTDVSVAGPMMETIASSMITIASVVFSILLVALSLASGQFGPRLIGNYMRDATTQAVMGTFTATYLFSLLVMRSIRPEDAAEGLFVPHFSIMVAIALAVISVMVLIYFIHHISVSIQAHEIMGRVGAELNDKIDRFFPEHMELGNSSQPPQPGVDFPADFENNALFINSTADGYVQCVDAEDLMKLLVREDLVMELKMRPGDYVIAGRPVALVWPGSRLNDRKRNEVNRLIVTGTQRTPGQDIVFMMEELVEMAVSALSTGLNEPSTASSCLDHLGSALCRLARSRAPSRWRRDKQGKVRLDAPTIPFPVIVDVAFNNIRQYGRGSVSVILRLLETIHVVAGEVQRPEDREALQRHLDMAVRAAREEFAEAEDLEAAERRYKQTRRLLEPPV